MTCKEKIEKTLAELSRLLLGVVFVFSGTTKAIDPMGGAIKIDDYLSAFNMDWLHWLDVLLSFNLSALEFMLGVCLLLGAYRRYASFLTLLMMGFMTPLTLYLAVFNPVSDCGCFGDVLVISNWQTFFKNVVLLAAAIYLFRHNQKILPLYTYHVYWFVAFWAYVFAIGFAYRNYYHLPILDFRPYKIGANIPALMSVPEDAPVDEYKYAFIYEKDGKQKEFSLEESPVNDTTWTFVESKTELVKRGYVPPISSFDIYNIAGDRVTDRLLGDSRPLFLLISPRLEEADVERIDEINNVCDYALENGIDFFCVTGSSEEEIVRWGDETGSEYGFLMADDVLLKTIIRSNPGLVLMEHGTVLGKWHYNDIPQEEELKTAITDCLLENTDQKAKEGARLMTNLLSFTVPLLLVWGYDFIRNRRRKQKEPTPVVE